ncbi:TPA: HK97 gp10 family phage protein [Klebsiella pneumoniae]|nr:HK97 gp10 family phage protein [Klebsiella pneumoniae]
MADGVEFKLTGVDELLGKLESITDDMKRKGGRAALRKAANIIANRAKANASRLDDPATGRSIADNIAVRWNGREFKRNGNRNILQGSHHIFHNDNSVFKNAEASGGLNNACRINGTGGIVACALNLGKKRAGIDYLQRNVVGEIFDNLSACSHVAMLRA